MVSKVTGTVKLICGEGNQQCNLVPRRNMYLYVVTGTVNLQDVIGKRVQ